MGRSPLRSLQHLAMKTLRLGSPSRPPETSLGKTAQVGWSCPVREGAGSVQRKAPSRPQGPCGPMGLCPEVLLTREDPRENQNLGLSPGPWAEESLCPFSLGNCPSLRSLESLVSAPTSTRKQNDLSIWRLDFPRVSPPSASSRTALGRGLPIEDQS